MGAPLGRLLPPGPLSRIFLLTALLLAGGLLFFSCQTGDTPPPETKRRPAADEPVRPPGDAAPPWAPAAERALDGFRREILNRSWTAAAERAEPRIRKGLLEEAGMAPRDLCLMLLGPGTEIPEDTDAAMPSKPMSLDQLSRLEYRASVYPEPAAGFVNGRLYFTNISRPVPSRIHFIHQEGRIYLTIPGWGAGSEKRRNP